MRSYSDAGSQLPDDIPVAELAEFRHVISGSPEALQAGIKALQKCGYAELSDWTVPIPTHKPDEFICVLLKYLPEV
ncbi:MAG: hypothetical protein F6J97_01870 [Leptolyngbya sp. SIO4C1]|nr:hypothetical protein [Leptolyngbya sp. SIO4C1]